jgi:membrane-associated protease RseP (regulator of RpoE activity)
MKRLWLHALLFAATCASTFFAGGPVFAATLMTILLTHELGHYFTARRHGIDVSLPYFIPMPLGIGTLGAVIRMRAPIARRDALADVGASGPLAGLAVAIPALVVGLLQSEVTVVPAGQQTLVEGNSLLYLGLKLAVKGLILPQGAPGGPQLDVQLSPMAFAAWVGLLVTFINLIPIGQLDGGHVAVALFGNDYERVAGWLHRCLVLVGGGVFFYLGMQARHAGRGPWEAIAYGASGAVPWAIWAVLLAIMRRFSARRYHPPVDGQPLSRRRQILCLITALAFILLFTPIPMREGL